MDVDKSNGRIVGMSMRDQGINIHEAVVQKNASTEQRNKRASGKWKRSSKACD